MPKKLVMSPSDLKLEPLIDALTKGDEGAILKGDYGFWDAEVPQGLLDATVLPEDLAKYFTTSILDLTNRQEEFLYEVSTILSFFQYNSIFTRILLAPFTLFFVV